MTPILLLDIDGVLPPFGDGVPTYPVFDNRCVENLKMLLTGVPLAKVVFSSTWRLPNYVNRLYEQWLEHGSTKAVAIDGTPDLRQDSSVLRRHQRGLEIRGEIHAGTGPQGMLQCFLTSRKSELGELVSQKMTHPNHAEQTLSHEKVCQRTAQPRRLADE